MRATRKWVVVLAVVFFVLVSNGCRKQPNALVDWSVEQPNRYALPVLSDGNCWIPVNVYVLNRGGVSIPVSRSAFLLDVDGQLYEADVAVTPLEDTELAKGQSLSGQLVFKVPIAIRYHCIVLKANDSYCRAWGVKSSKVKFRYKGPLIAENDSYRGEISDATGRPKDVYVHGYYRKDGTYVRGHYRSSPRR